MLGNKKSGIRLHEMPRPLQFPEHAQTRLPAGFLAALASLRGDGETLQGVLRRAVAEFIQRHHQPKKDNK